MLALAVANFILLAWHPVHPTDWEDEEAKKADEQKGKEEARKADEARKEEERKRLEKEKRDEKDRIQAITDKLTPEENHYWTQQVKLVDLAKRLSDELKNLYALLVETPAEVEKTVKDAAALRQRWAGKAQAAKVLLAEASRLDADQLAVRAWRIAPESSKSDASLPAENKIPESSDKESNESRVDALFRKAIETGKSRLGPLYAIADSHDKLESAILQIDQLKHDLYWNEANTDGWKIVQRVRELRGDLPEIEKPLNHIEKLFKDKAASGSEFRLGPNMMFDLCKTKLDDLNRDFAAIAVPIAGNPRFGDYKRLEPVVKECRTLFKGLEEKRAAGLEVPSRSRLKILREQLDAIPEDLSRAYLLTLGALEELKKITNARLKTVEGRPRWFYRLADLVA